MAKTDALNKRRQGSAMKKSENDVHQELPRNARKFLAVDKILIPRDKDGDLDPALVSELAESFKLSSQLAPILVRRLKRREHGKRYVLVAGAHRLTALTYIGAEKADCILVMGNETQARLAALAENLWRKNLTVLKRSELLAEYWQTVRLKVSGQVGQKPGRPTGGIAAVARALPALGRSEEARRKIISRSLKIAALSPEAKVKAKEAGFENNERALLTIAKSNNRKAQLKKVSELQQNIEKPNLVPGHSATSAVKSSGPKLQSPLQLKGGEHQQELASKPNNAAEPHQETSLEQLEMLWKEQGCQKLWANTPFETRERFIEQLRRAKCKAKLDVCDFIKNVSYGRSKVQKKQLFALATTKGISKKTLTSTLKDLGFKSKRVGRGHYATWYFTNPNRDAESQLPSISNKELKAALEAKQKRATQETPELDNSSETYDSYYDL
jgi:ParB-like chromosome segregation protein Spo0J